MPDNFIAIDTAALLNSINEINAKLSKLPGVVRDEAVDATSDYLIEVLKQQPSYKYVSRKSAYGVTFFTDKQRRWFFANLNSGDLQLPYKRTQTFRNAWQQVGKGEKSVIANETPYAPYLMGDTTQSRHAKAIGWKTVSEVVRSRTDQIGRKIDAAVKKALKILGL